MLFVFAWAVFVRGQTQDNPCAIRTLNLKYCQSYPFNPNRNQHKQRVARERSWDVVVYVGGRHEFIHISPCVLPTTGISGLIRDLGTNICAQRKAKWLALCDSGCVLVCS